MNRASLGCGVDRAVGAPLEGGDRADGDDAAAPALHHAARHLLAHEDGAEQVAVDNGAHVLLLDVHGVVGIGLAAHCGYIAARVVHQNVDGSEFGNGGQRALDVGAARKIAESLRGPHAVPRGDGAGDVAQRLAAAVLGRPLLAHAVHADVATHRREALGERTAETAASPRYESHLAFEDPINHVASPSRAP